MTRGYGVETLWHVKGLFAPQYGHLGWIVKKEKKVVFEPKQKDADLWIFSRIICELRGKGICLDLDVTEQEEKSMKIEEMFAMESDEKADELAKDEWRTRHAATANEGCWIGFGSARVTFGSVRLERKLLCGCQLFVEENVINIC